MARNSTTWKPGTVTNPRGRAPKTIAARDLAAITKLAARGCREKDIARAVGVSPPTWARIRDADPDVRAAFDAGRQVMHDALIGKLYEKAMGGDTVSLIFACKILLGYRENDAAVEFKPQVTITLPGALPLEKFAALEREARLLPHKEVRDA